MRLMYHIPQNSFYLEIVRVKYRCDEYIKAHVRYYYKNSLTMFCEERNIKIKTSVMVHWHKEYV